MTDNERPFNEQTPGKDETPVAGTTPVANEGASGPRRNWPVIAIVGAVLLVMILVGVRKSRQGGADGTSLHVAKVKGAVAPEFALQDVETGKTVRLSEFKGKAVLLNFWATWCPPCKVEIPWFVDLQKQYGPDGLVVIGVAMDDAERQEIAAFTRSMGVNYPILLGTNAISDTYGGVERLPTTFFIGRDGKITERVFGATSHGHVEEKVKAALAQGSGGETAGN
ncbi:MAG TPA: TlpA disulfide reductase family protein [Terriglobales bacterium]|nr:TlpA disulfide reductase family protein [Terriglobales bacterium]